MSNVAQRSFAAGELAPSLHARVDLGKYATGLRTCRNLIVQRQGGVTSRPGLSYVGTVLGVSRLIPFVFSNTQSYMLVFTGITLSFVQNGAFIQSGGVNYTIPTPYLEADLPDLRFAQSADVVTITHPSYAPRNLKRLATTNWTLTAISFTSSVPVANVVSAVGGIVNALSTTYAVSAVSNDTGAEGMLTGATATAALTIPDGTNNIVVTYTAVAGYTYNIYRSIGLTQFGIVAYNQSSGVWRDTGVQADYNVTGTVARNPFSGGGLYPTAVAYFQERRLYGRSNTYPERLWASRPGDYDNFSVTSPVAADDAITADLVSRKVSGISHIVDAGILIILTDGGEWVVPGGASNAVTPTDFAVRKYTEHGASRLPPIRADQRLLYVQARGSIVRDLAIDPSIQYHGLQGRDLTLLSTHLVDGYSIDSWSYAESPHSVIWMARSDGAFLSLTFLDEQQVLGWARHDTAGRVEQVCVIPEGSEDRVYMVVQRASGRFLERLRSLAFTDIASDAAFLDSSQTYDGRNADPTFTMRVTGGVAWDETELLTVTATTAVFVPTEAGNQVVLTSVDGTTLRVTVSAYTSPTVVQGFPTRTMPVDLRGTATASWARAVKSVSGLTHLAGVIVSVFGDGYVVASPNNSVYPTLTVSGSGTLALPAPYMVIHVGLPYTQDLQTLDIDQPEGGSFKPNRLLINRVVMMVQKTRGLWTAQTDTDPTTDLTTGFSEAKIRSIEPYGTPVSLVTGTVEFDVTASYSASGRVSVRQVDPLPMTVLAVIPIGLFPPAR